MSQGWQGPPNNPQQGGYQQPPNQQQPYYPPPGYGVRPPPANNTAVIIIAVVVGLVVVIGILAAFAISGVRSYLTSAKTAEAKNTLLALKRDVQRTYEAEPHKLCGSAEPVPDHVPKGTKSLPGKGFDSGSDTQGWKCLKFSMSTPSYYQYDYRVGGFYKGPSRGGPDPGPDGFEISAEGDLDGDGVTSLFTLTGKVDPKTHELKVDDSVFMVNERD